MPFCFLYSISVSAQKYEMCMLMMVSCLLMVMKMISGSTSTDNRPPPRSKLFLSSLLCLKLNFALLTHSSELDLLAAELGNEFDDEIRFWK